MSHSPSAAPLLDQDVHGLTYQRTVDRSLVHRRALTEVFLTDTRALAADRYVTGAQLPALHAYYA
nr:hypothetical protein [Micromonospora sp. DSM 115978]